VKRHAFSLIELLAVVAVIGIIAALVVPSFNSITRAQALTTGASALIDELASARQAALAQNRVVEVRIYKRTEEPGINDGSVPQFRAFGTVIYDEEVRNWHPLTAIRPLPPRIIVLGNKEFSTLMHPYSKLIPSRVLKEQDLPEGKVPFQVIRFRPTGGTDLSPAGAPDDDKWFLTVASENDKPSDGKPGYNYVTVMLDPVSGRARIFRP
jgi:uncharacterized protein (TIGR02596 family)